MNLCKKFFLQVSSSTFFAEGLDKTKIGDKIISNKEEGSIKKVSNIVQIKRIFKLILQFEGNAS